MSSRFVKNKAGTAITTMCACAALLLAGCGGVDEQPASTDQQRMENAAMHLAVEKARKANAAKMRGERSAATN
jgi:hypothetical protein